MSTGWQASKETIIFINITPLASTIASTARRFEDADNQSTLRKNGDRKSIYQISAATRPVLIYQRHPQIQDFLSCRRIPTFPTPHRFPIFHSRFPFRYPGSPLCGLPHTSSQHPPPSPRTELSAVTMSIDTKVAVSGVSGFIGAQVACDLLHRGYTVHGTVRKNVPEKTQHLTALDGYPGALKIFEADLLVPGSFDEAVADCDYAMHIASPYFLNAKDPQKDLIDPAVNGTLCFLKACHKALVKKVVLTSSFAAVTDHGEKNKVFDEGDWNTTSTVDSLAYYHSKAMAERAAWKFVEETAPEMKLVVINPVGVIGPSLIKPMNETMTIIANTVEGKFYGVVDLSFTFVDVRDVSEAHIRAMESDTASGRYICCCDRLVSHRELVDLLVEAGFQPPTRSLVSKVMTSVIKTMSYVVPGGEAGVFTRNQLGNSPVPTNAKIIQDLDIEFRDAAAIVKETIQDMIRHGHITPEN